MCIRDSNYQTPEIYHGISDFSADSLALAVEAAKTKADIIVMCGVHFMAETAKLMSPEKKVLLPDMKAGCSLSASITGKPDNAPTTSGNVALTPPASIGIMALNFFPIISSTFFQSDLYNHLSSLKL